MVCQKAAPTWLPFVDVNYTLFISLSSDRYGPTYTLAGLEVNLLVKSWLALLSSRRNTQTRGTRVVSVRGRSERAIIRTISRMLAVVDGWLVLRGCMGGCRRVEATRRCWRR
jgi:hypothetical protein